MLKALKNIVIIVIMIGVITAIIDYKLLKDYKKPLFCIKTYNEIKHTETYRGLFYQAKRITNNSNKEEITDSKFITYYVLLYPINIKINQDNSNKESTIIYKKTDNCTNEPTLYYEDENTYIYTQCIDEINIKEANKETNLKEYLKEDKIENILNETFFTGYKKINYEKYTTDYSNENLNLNIIKCTNNEKNILYIMPKDVIELSEYCNITIKEPDNNPQ